MPMNATQALKSPAKNGVAAKAIDTLSPVKPTMQSPVKNLGRSGIL